MKTEPAILAAGILLLMMGFIAASDETNYAVCRQKGFAYYVPTNYLLCTVFKDFWDERRNAAKRVAEQAAAGKKKLLIFRHKGKYYYRTIPMGSWPRDRGHE